MQRKLRFFVAFDVIFGQILANHAASKHSDVAGPRPNLWRHGWGYAPSRILNFIFLDSRSFSCYGQFKNAYILRSGCGVMLNLINLTMMAMKARICTISRFFLLAASRAILLLCQKISSIYLLLKVSNMRLKICFLRFLATASNVFIYRPELIFMKFLFRLTVSESLWQNASIKCLEFSHK